MKRFLIIIGAAALLSGCANPQVRQAIVQGQLFCAQITADGKLIKKVATTSGVPVSVIGQSQAQVVAWCALINAVPVSPPAAPEQVPTANVVPPTS